MQESVHGRARALAGELKPTLRLAVPLVFGQLSAVGMNVVDALLAGHLDAHTLAAVAVGTSVWALAIVSAIGVTMALQPSVAQLSGAGRPELIGPLFRQALWLALALGIVLSLAIATLGPLLVVLIGVDPALVTDTTRFLHAIAPGAPALTLYFTLRGFSEGLGRTRPTLYFGLFGLALLVPLGYVLMYGRLGLPRLGALGSGIATALVLWLQVGALALYVALRHHYRAYRPFARMERPDPRILRDLLRIGVPMGVTLFMEASLFVAVALILGTLGTDIVASHQIALNVASIAFMVPLGVAMATTVRVGYAAGRGDQAEVRRAGLAGMLLVLATQGLSSALMLLLPARIAALYTSDAKVIALAAQLLLLAGLFQFSDGIQATANGALRGLKDTRVPMFITLFAYWLVGMPIGWWLAFHQGLGARGMWMGLIAGLSVAALLLPWRFWRLSRRPQADFG
ncbi:MATE family efflux transporter [Dokdonella sp.]|uniref:MATE family efflux transporter n=1 Tax=Dokdonella sp. TaxID=2291710 RepID=UPI0031BEB865|nr:MATE family efflux transporter [Dokdonella sp.]